jgi:oligopeptide transport system ATP-binding protein
VSRDVLAVDDLAVRFHGEGGAVDAVEGVSFRLAEGETLAVVGESSSGKSVTALALMRLLGGPPGCLVRGRALLTRADGETVDLLSAPEARMAAVRGRDIGMIFQEPMTSLNPVHRIGAQIAESLLAHERLSRRAAEARAVALLDRVGIPEPALRARAYPHQLSGGMRQRAMIATALACRPRVLIADEPTTALDVTIQAQILELIRALQAETGMSVLFITHNLGVVAEIADRVLVLYAGQVVETAPAETLLRAPLMPYTAGLIGSVPRLDHVRARGGRLPAIPGNVPQPRARPAGCLFHPRCGHARPSPCEAARPPLEHAAAEHDVRCARWREIAA